jgi:hypothetical protein
MYGICASATYRSSVRGLIPSKAAASLQLISTSSLIRSIPRRPVAEDIGSNAKFSRQVGSSPRLRQISILVGRCHSRPSLEPAAQGFKTLESVKQLHTRLPHRIAGFTKLIGVSDGEFDPINRDPNLICHFKFERKAATLHRLGWPR